MADEKTPVETDPSFGLIEQTDNGLKPDDPQEQAIDGKPLADMTLDEVMALHVPEGGE